MHPKHPPRAGLLPAPPELGEGTTNFLPDASPDALGRGYTHSTVLPGNTTVTTEDLVIFDKAQYDQDGPLTWKSQGAGSANSLTTAVLAELALLQAQFPAPFVHAHLVFQYAAMPTQQMIDALPSTNAAGITTRYYDLRVNASTVSAGQLFRERELKDGKELLTDFWVLFDTYVFPIGPDTVKVVRNDSAGSPTTRKAFLQAMLNKWLAVADPVARARWKYTAIPYSWGPLPSTPPPPP